MGANSGVTKRSQVQEHQVCAPRDTAWNCQRQDSNSGLLTLGTEPVLIPEKFLGRDSPVPIRCCPAQRKSRLLIPRRKARVLRGCPGWGLTRELVFVGQRCPETRGRPTGTKTNRRKRDTESSVAEQSSFEADA